MVTGKNVTNLVQYGPRTYFESNDSSTPEYLYLLRFARYSVGMYRLPLMTTTAACCERERRGERVGREGERAAKKVKKEKEEVNVGCTDDIHVTFTEFLSFTCAERDQVCCEFAAALPPIQRLIICQWLTRSISDSLTWHWA